jgi:hypothetical protein
MLKPTLLILSIVLTQFSFGQSENTITLTETDSSEIRQWHSYYSYNYHETYLHKDSVCFEEYYLSDTTQLRHVGWERKNRLKFGEWHSFTEDGTWLKTIDYTNFTWKYNPKEYKFQAQKEALINVADSLIIQKFGEEFFNQNIIYDLEHGTFADEKRHESYQLDYVIKLSEDEFCHTLLRVTIDSTGQFLPVQSDLDDIIPTQKSTMAINRSNAIEVCLQNFIRNSNSEFQAYLLYGYDSSPELTQRWYYEVSQVYHSESEKNDLGSIYTSYCNVWRFDPWTMELISAKPMKKTINVFFDCAHEGAFIEIE